MGPDNPPHALGTGGLGHDVVCSVSGCPLRSEGPNQHLCRHHYISWRWSGRPTDLDAWTARLSERPRPRIQLGRLSPSLRLEVAYGLQLWSQDGTRYMRPAIAQRAVRFLVTSGITSLLDVHLEDWDSWWKNIPGVRLADAKGKQFLHQTRIGLDELFHESEDPWSVQFPLDRWDLQMLGLSTSRQRSLNFQSIVQPWLQQLAKKWARWRLLRGISASAVGDSLCGVISLSRNIARRDGHNGRPEALDRVRLELWLTDLAIEYRERPAQRASYIRYVGLLLRDNLLHDWVPEIPRTARIERDAPTVRRPARRTISDYVLRQISAPASLARFPSDDGRLLIRLGLACGLRLSDARQLPFDCLIYDPEDNPYLAWINRKTSNEPGYFPISNDLAKHIRVQQIATTTRFPHGSPWLFPATANNVTGSKALRHDRPRLQLRRWLEDLNVTNEKGERVNITYHQFRHTLATRMLNQGVPLSVVQELLGHSSPETTALYARYNLDTLRRHWQRTLPSTEGEAFTRRPEPEAKAQGTTGGVNPDVVSPAVTLPHGRCGAPPQISCEFANPCLGCQFFDTDPTYRAQHERQRANTVEAINAAQCRGHTRVVENNERTLIALDALLASLSGSSTDKS